MAGTRALPGQAEPFPGTSCNRHKPTEDCGLLLSRYFTTNEPHPSLNNISQFLQGLDTLPNELLDQACIDLCYRVSYMRSIWLDTANRISFKLLSAGNAWQRTTFCYIQGIVEALHRMTQDQDANEQEIRGAQWLLDCFLENYLGPRLMVQLKCYESADHKAKTLNQLSRTWLTSLSPLHQHLRHITLDLAITEFPKDEHDRESVGLCNYIASMLPNLRTVTLYLHLSEEQLVHTINFPKQQGWVHACRKLASGARIEQTEFRISLTQIKKTFTKDWDWSNGYTWNGILQQRRTREDKWWRKNILGH